jgi:2-aminoethylphosphonate-pyruvate transaminase
MLLLIPGPVQTRPEVRAAADIDIAPWDDESRAPYAALREKLLALAGGVPGCHACLPLQGCGHFIVEAAIRSFVPRGGRVLIPNNGEYGMRSARLAREAARVPVELALPDTAPVPPEAVAQALAADPAIGHVMLVQSETGSGVVNDVAAIEAVVRAAGRRLIVDAVSAFGALPMNVAALPACDAVVFTSNKCLEGLPGLGIAIAAVPALEQATGRAESWSFDLGDLYAHALRSGWGSYRFTPPVQVAMALARALEFLEAEGGPAARLARYRRHARLLHDGVQALGLRPYLDWSVQGPVIVTVQAPDDPAWDLKRFVAALKARGVLISNFYSTPTPSFRVGCIGAVAEADMRRALAAMEEALAELGIGRRAPRAA